jgi:hypothetical protein
MRYFTDGAGHVARVLTDAPFGDEFSEADAETYNVTREEWVEAPGMTTEIRFGGDWVPCTVAVARRIIESRGERRQEPVH